MGEKEATTASGLLGCGVWLWVLIVGFSIIVALVNRMPTVLLVPFVILCFWYALRR